MTTPRVTLVILALALVTAPAACDRPAEAADPVRADSTARARQDSINRAQPGYVVDSILPIEEALRRFRAGLGPAPAGLVGGAASRHELVRRLTDALEAGDTKALVSLLMDRVEFAWLVYPESPWTAPPLRQGPGLVWMLASRESSAGLGRLLARLGGRPLGYQSYACDARPEIVGRSRVWRGCVVRFLRAPGDTASMRLFAGIIEREGRFKVYSYANDL